MKNIFEKFFMSNIYIYSENNDFECGTESYVSETRSLRDRIKIVTNFSLFFLVSLTYYKHQHIYKNLHKHEKTGHGTNSF